MCHYDSFSCCGMNGIRVNLQLFLNSLCFRYQEKCFMKPSRQDSSRLLTALAVWIVILKCGSLLLVIRIDNDWPNSARRFQIQYNVDIIDCVEFLLFQCYDADIVTLLFTLHSSVQSTCVQSKSIPDLYKMIFKTGWQCPLM